MKNSVFARLRIIGWLEGTSFLVLLLIAMPRKYVWDDPSWVRVVGMAHGLLFVLYIIAAFQAHVQASWPWRRTFVIMVASVLPGGPFWVDRRYLSGH